MTARLQAWCLTAGLVLLAGTAHAQTITVTNATPGATVEAAWNGAPAGMATVDALGHATIALRQLTEADATLDMRVVVDTCGGLWRVFVMQVGLAAPAPQAGCTRQEIAGVFVVRPVSTLVITVSGSSATMLLRQGPFDPTAPIQAEREAPTGLVLFGGAGLTTTGGDVGTRSCGDAPSCERGGTGLGYTAGAAFWFVPFVAAEVTFLKPSDVSVEGEDVGQRFTTAMDAHVLTLAGVFGVPVSNARIYGKAGVTYHRATLTTTQTIDPSSIAIDAETTLEMPGGTQTLQSQTGGRGWLFGGGLEVWANRTLGFYLEGGWAGLEGTDLDEGEATLDDRALYLVGGLRLRIGF